MLDTEQGGSQTAKAIARTTMRLGGTTRSSTQVGEATRNPFVLEIEQEESQEAKATTRPMTQPGGSTRFIAQVGDTTRSFPVIETEQEGNQVIKATTRLIAQAGGTTRSTKQVGDMTRLTARMGSTTELINSLINGKKEARPEGRGERKSRRLATKKPEGENDVRDKTSDDEEENPKALGEDRNKTMIATWGIMELNTRMTLLQGETIERDVLVIMLKVLVLGNKETEKCG